MELAFINREVARWARERRGLNKGELADKLGVSSQQITQWETGPQFPPLGRAQALATVLGIPFGYLFLSERPAEKPPIPDLRRVTQDRRPPSADFIDLLNDIIIKHDWYVEYAKESGATRLPFVGRSITKTPLSRVVAEIESVMRSQELRRNANTWSDYLRLLTRRAEEFGILVMRAGVVRGNANRKLSVSEFRGFALYDPVAPLVFINSRDAIAAQVFTLAHELVHIWLGQSGISNPDLARKTEPKAHEEVIEQFCNAAAAEFLVPVSEFQIAWANAVGSGDSKSQQLAKRFRVSVPVILRRANERGYISHNEFVEIWKIHEERVEASERKREEEEAPAGGNFYNTFFARNSYKFTSAIVKVVKSGEVGPLEAARILSVRTTTIPKLAERLQG